jgi:hypothetical protein
MRFVISPNLALVAATLGVCAPSARATVMLPLTVHQQTRQAELIVRARVLAVTPYAARRREVWTRTLLRTTADAIKGHLRRHSTISVVQPGGELKRTGMHVAGSAKFRRSEDVLLFLVSAGSGQYAPLALAQSKYEVFLDRQGVMRVRRDLTGIAFYHSASSEKSSRSPSEPGVFVAQPVVRLLAPAQKQLQYLMAEIENALDRGPR